MAVHLAKWSSWIDQGAQAGHMLPGGEPLELDGKTVRGSNKTIIDGPFAEAKDLVTGVLFIAADSIDVAVELARDCPSPTAKSCSFARPDVYWPAHGVQ